MSEDSTPSAKPVELSNSLLEDASTLLMFHNGVVPKESEILSNEPQSQQQQSHTTPERIEEPLTKPEVLSLLPSQPVFRGPASSSGPSSTPNDSVIRSPKIQSIASPGPAIAALADSDAVHGENDNKSQKGIVAAAALAAAAGIPLPLINHCDQKSLDLQVIEKLKDNGVESSEAILQRAQSQVSKEQLEALKERAEVIRQGLKNIVKDEAKQNEALIENHSQDSNTKKENQQEKNGEENDTKLEDIKPDANDTDVEGKGSDDTIIKSNTTIDDIQNNETEEESSTLLDKRPEYEPKPKKQRKIKKKELSPSQGISTNNTSSQIPQAVPKDYIVDPDAGIISCVCGYEDDDGFTIQCDNCFRWQHAICMGIDSIDNAPDDYLCNVCSPRKIDVKKAKAAQTQRLNALKRKQRRQASRNSVDFDGQESSGQESSSSNGGTAGTNRDSNNQKTLEAQSQDPQNDNQIQIKPKPKPKPNSYGKNLEDDDIHVLDAKDSYKSTYYPLNNYDYQDEEVYDFVNSLKNLQDPRFKQLNKSEFNKQNLPKLNVKPYSEVNNKKFNGVSRLGLFTETAIPQGGMVGEYLGEVGNKDKYITDPRNHYRIWGVEKANVQFIPGLPLVIDARLSGNSTRYIRRSCNSNCELKTVVVSKEFIKFIIFAIKPIKVGAELTLNWNWDLNHPIRGILEGKQFDQINDAVKPSLVLSIESILTFVECACTSVNECSVSKVKKASAHIYRSTRKGNNTSGLKLLRNEARYSSIQERLLERETSSLRDSSAQVKSSIPLPSLTSGFNTEVPDISIRPFLYGYLTKRRKLDPAAVPIPSSKDRNTYLPIPIQVKAEVKEVEISKDNVLNLPAKPVKKLSFADYKKIKKPT